jgi:hypothetical protein
MFTAQFAKKLLAFLWVRGNVLTVPVGWMAVLCPTENIE